MLPFHHIVTFRQLLRASLFAALFLLVVPSTFAQLVDGQELQETNQQRDHPLSPSAESCSTKGMKLIAESKSFGAICEPPGHSRISRMTACLMHAMEVVLVPERSGIVCASPSRGSHYLTGPATEGGREPRYPHPHRINPKEACKQGSNVRNLVLDRRIIKELVRDSKEKIDPGGIRIIGGLFCDGLDLSGLNLPYSLILDRSIFLCIQAIECQARPVDIRNFRTTGDLSFDYAVAYDSILIRRTEISGSFFATFSFIKQLEISDSSIVGTIKLHDSLVAERLTIENVSVGGDLDLSAGYFSHLVVLKDKIDGTLDFSQTQARCSFDIRKNEIGDTVAVQFGFGSVVPLWTKGFGHSFKKLTDNPIFGLAFGRPLKSAAGANIPDPYDTYGDESSITKKYIPDEKTCEPFRLIKPGTLVFVDNHVKSSLCIRAFNWLTDQGNRTRESNIYLNEDIIDGATWLDVTQPVSTVLEQQRQEAILSEPILSIFNVRTGTLVLNFNLAKQYVKLKVNGLHFERIYHSTTVCESALSLRSGRRRTVGEKTSSAALAFPPDLRLPHTELVSDWVKKNEFKGTQPFQEFVAVFEKAGDLNAARDLKIQEQTATVEARLCISWGVHCGSAVQQETVGDGIAHRIEARLVSILQYILWWLADHGFRPERVVWFVAGTLAIFWLFIQLGAGIVGFSVDGELGAPRRIKPISLMFLLGKLVPAYNIREEHAKRLKFYVLPTEEGCDLYPFKRFWNELSVTEASPKQQERAELCLDALRLLGLIFAIFLVAAIGRLVR